MMSGRRWRRAVACGMIGFYVVFAGSASAAVSPTPAMMNWMQAHTGSRQMSGTSAVRVGGPVVYEVFGRRPHKPGHVQPTLIIFAGAGSRHLVEFDSSDGVVTRMFHFRHLRNVPRRLRALHGRL